MNIFQAAMAFYRPPQSRDIKIKRNYFAGLMTVPAKNLNAQILKDAVNSEAKRKTKQGKPLSSKTITNAYSLSASASPDGYITAREVMIDAEGKAITKSIDMYWQNKMKP